jgi:hypothetical protein
MGFSPKNAQYTLNIGVSSADDSRSWYTWKLQWESVALIGIPRIDMVTRTPADLNRFDAVSWASRCVTVRVLTYFVQVRSLELNKSTSTSYCTT